jgi:hypothetical protein
MDRRMALQVEAHSLKKQQEQAVHAMTAFKGRSVNQSEQGRGRYQERENGPELRWTALTCLVRRSIERVAEMGDIMKANRKREPDGESRSSPDRNNGPP